MSKNDVKNITDVMSQVTTNVLVRNRNSVSTQVFNSQLITFDNQGEINCATDFKLIQTLTGTYDLVTQITAQDTDEIKLELDKVLRETQENKQKVTNEALSNIFSVNWTTSSTEIVNRIRNIVQSNVTQETINQSFQQVQSQQEIKFVNKGLITGGGSCEINQYMLVNLVSNQIVSSIIRTVSESKEIIDLATIQKSDQTVENKGIDIWGWVWIVALVIGAVLVFALIFFGFFKKGGGKGAETSIIVPNIFGGSM